MFIVTITFCLIGLVLMAVGGIFVMLHIENKENEATMTDPEDLES
jgi:hypothetical protein